MKQIKLPKEEELKGIFLLHMRRLEKMIFPYYNVIPYKTIYSYFGRKFHVSKQEAKKILKELSEDGRVIMKKRGITLNI